MLEQLAYLNDPLTLEFEAKIIHKTKAANGQFEVILEKTYFYPTGGGQTHDTGALGEARVVDVFKDPAGNVVHRLDRDISATTVPARIDYDLRLANMQHHSAQHILSRSFEAVLDLETLSARISSATPSTIDVPLKEVDQADLDRVEQFANGIIFQDRPIKSYVITGDQRHTVPFRRPPKVKGQIRVVEIESFDYSACGGTHCPRTGMIGLIKILKTGTQNQKLRVHFVAGQQALRYFQDYHHLVTEMSRSLSAGPDELLSVFNRQLDQARLAQQEIRKMAADKLALEAGLLLERAEPFQDYKLILASFEHRTAAELRELGKLLRETAGVIALLAGYEGQKLSLVAACAGDVNVSAKALLAHQLAFIDGRGGGNDQFAQGGGQAAQQQIETFFDQTKAYIIQQIQGA